MSAPSNPFAFPVHWDAPSAPEPGMTLRQWYAGQALGALGAIIATAIGNSVDAKIIAEGAFAVADAMLAHEESSNALTSATADLLAALQSARKLIDDLGLSFPEADQKFDGTWASYRDEFDAALAAARGDR